MPTQIEVVTIEPEIITIQTPHISEALQNIDPMVYQQLLERDRHHRRYNGRTVDSVTAQMVMGDNHEISACTHRGNSGIETRECGACHSIFLRNLVRDAFNAAGQARSTCAGCITSDYEMYDGNYFHRESFVALEGVGRVPTRHPVFAQNYFVCSGCEEVHQIRGNRCGRCSQCGDCCREDSVCTTSPDSMGKRFRFAPTKKYGFELPDQINNTFGVELETSNTPFNVEAEGFTNVSDGSISGREYVSGIFNGEKGLNHLAQFCEFMTNHKFKVDKKCGYHLHLGSGHMKLENLSSLIQIYRIVEPMIYAMIAPSRLTSSWCRPIKSAPNFRNNYSLEKYNYYDKLGEKIKVKGDALQVRMDESKRHKYSSSRYFGFNLHSHFFRGTIELRYHHGTLHYEKVCRWVQLHMYLFHLGMTIAPRELFRVNRRGNNAASAFEWFKQKMITHRVFSSKETLKIIRYVALRMHEFSEGAVDVDTSIKLEGEA